MLRDRTLPEGRWEFDAAVTAVFDDMLERSIPDYAGMRELVATVAEFYARDAPAGSAIVDLGCSHGAALAGVRDRLQRPLRYVGVELAEPMRRAAEARFRGDDVDILDLDLRERYPEAPATVTLCVLTLQFIPIEYRQAVLERAFAATVPGGAFILVEKVLGEDAHADSMLVDRYLQLKGDNGYTEEQIAAKRTALEGVLVPITARWNVDLLERAGFRHVQQFWQHLNFAGWVAVR